MATVMLFSTWICGSRLVELIKPLFPFVRDWTIIDKIWTTLSMLCVIRGLYFLPITGIEPNKIPENLQLSSPGESCHGHAKMAIGMYIAEQIMLERIFMAEDSIPLNIALLGIGPIIVSGFLMQLVLNVPVFQILPGPFQEILSRKKMGTLTNVRTNAFAIVCAFLKAVHRERSRRCHSTLPCSLDFSWSVTLLRVR